MVIKLLEDREVSDDINESVGYDFQSAESVANIGRMVCIMPILQFIAKELRITSTEYDSFITKSGVDRVQPSLT